MGAPHQLEVRENMGNKQRRPRRPGNPGVVAQETRKETEADVILEAK